MSENIQSINLTEAHKSRFYNQLIENNVSVAAYHTLDDAIERLKFKSLIDSAQQDYPIYIDNSQIILYGLFNVRKNIKSINVSFILSDFTWATITIFTNDDGNINKCMLQNQNINNFWQPNLFEVNNIDDNLVLIVNDMPSEIKDKIVPTTSTAHITFNNIKLFDNSDENIKYHRVFKSLVDAVDFIKLDNINVKVEEFDEDPAVGLTYIDNDVRQPILHLLSDINLTELIYLDHNLMLNLNEHTLTLSDYGAIRNHKNQKAILSENDYLALDDSYNPNLRNFDYDFYMFDGSVVYKGRPDDGELSYAAIELYNCNDVIIYNVKFNSTFNSKDNSDNTAMGADFGLKLSHSNVWIDRCEFNNTLLNDSPTGAELTTNEALSVDVSSVTSTSQIISMGVQRIVPFFQFVFYDSNNKQIGYGYDYWYTQNDTTLNGTTAALQISSVTGGGISISKNRLFGNINYYDGTFTLDEKVIGKVSRVMFKCLSGYDSSNYLKPFNTNYYTVNSATGVCVNGGVFSRSYSPYFGNPIEVSPSNSSYIYMHPELLTNVVLTNIDLNAKGNFDGPFEICSTSFSNVKMQNVFTVLRSTCYPTIYYNLTARAQCMNFGYGRIHTRDCFNSITSEDIGAKSNWTIPEPILRDNSPGAAMNVSSSNICLLNTEAHAVRDGISGVNEAKYILPGSQLNKRNARIPTHIISGGFYSSSGHGGVYTTGSTTFAHKNSEMGFTADYHYSSGYTSSFVRPTNIIFRDASFGRLTAKNETHYTGASGSGYWGYGSYSYFDNCTLGLLRDELNQSGVSMVFNITGSIAIGEEDVCYMLNPTLVYNNAVTNSTGSRVHENKLCDPSSVAMITLKQNYKSQIEYTIPNKYCPDTPSKTGTSVTLNDMPNDGSLSLIFGFNGLYAPYTDEVPLVDVILYRKDDVNYENPEYIIRREDVLDTYVEGTADKWEHYLTGTYEILHVYPGDRLVIQHEIHSDENDETIYSRPYIRFKQNDNFLGPEIYMWNTIDTCCKFDKQGVANIHTSIGYKQGITNPQYGNYLKTIFIDPMRYMYIDDIGVRHEIPIPSRSTGFISNSRLYGPMAFRNDYLSKEYVGENNKYGTTILDCTNDFNQLCIDNPDVTISQKPNSANNSVVVTNKNYRKRLPHWQFYFDK